MDALAVLALQVDWGADEALAESPIDRLRAQAPPSAPTFPKLARSVATPHANAVTGEAAAMAAQAGSEEELRAALLAFDGCALRDTASSLVFADGRPTSGLMVVGEAPGEAEERAGRPFAGTAGAMLDRMIGSIGLSRESVGIGMLVPWRPPGGRPITETEIACCLPFLLRLIALTSPRRLLLMGPAAVRALAGLAPGTRRVPRGQWLDIAVGPPAETVAGLPTANLSSIQTKAAERRRVWTDLRLVKRALDADLANL